MKIVPEISLRHDLQYFLFISTPTIDIEPILSDNGYLGQANRSVYMASDSYFKGRECLRYWSADAIHCFTVSTFTMTALAMKSTSMPML